jgi:hypothetical protein
MTKWLLVLAFVIPLNSFAQTSTTVAPPPLPNVSPADAAPLDLIISQVKAALDLYQQNVGSTPDALPPLTSAEFDFKTTTAKVEGFTINLLIFKIGGSHEKDVVNDVTFTYAVPAPTAGLRTRKKPPMLTEQLANTIQNAAVSVKACKQFGKLSFTKFTVNVQYGVKWDGNIGANVPISLVTLGLSADVNKNTVQSVKLVFGQ